MTYISPFPLWGAGGHHVAVLPPSYGDLFVLTTVLGRRVSLDHIGNYEQAVRRAHAMADRIVHHVPVVIKVLCLSAVESCKLHGIDPATLFADETPEQEAQMRQHIITSMTQLLHTSSDPRVRSDALKLLTDLGAIQ
jgi:hypothetical protein